MGGCSPSTATEHEMGPPPSVSNLLAPTARPHYIEPNRQMQDYLGFHRLNSGCIWVRQHEMYYPHFPVDRLLPEQRAL